MRFLTATTPNLTERYTAAFGLLLGALIWLASPHSISSAWPLMLNIVLAAVVLGAMPWLRSTPPPLVRYLAIGFPLLAFYAFYREMAVPLAAPDVRWHDNFFLRLEGQLWATPGTLRIPLLASLLAVAYHAYMPLLIVATAAVFRPGDRRGAERMTAMVGAICLGWGVCYLFFIFFPVMGPRFQSPEVQFTRLGEGMLAEFAAFYQDRGMHRGCAFPSAHVAGAVTALAALARWCRPLFWCVLPVGVGLTAGAVYFGYHYVADVLAGAAVGTGAVWAMLRHGDGAEEPASLPS
jgi:hypothetical protein